MTIKDIHRLQEQGKIRGYKLNVGKPDSVTLQAAKRSKYGNIKVVVDNIKFDSTKEAERYQELKLLQAQGIISELRLQVGYQLNDGGKYSFKYVADFVYYSEGQFVCEDVKPYDKSKKKFILTALFKKKMRLMFKIHGIKIKIT